MLLCSKFKIFNLEFKNKGEKSLKYRVNKGFFYDIYMSETNNQQNLGGQGISGKSKFSQKEEEILAFWNENKIFQKSLDKESPKGEFVFYDGPPTANGMPGIHHLIPQSFKDVIPRYKTMQGFHVRRKGGWDTHGLPVELLVEKELGLKSKKEIEIYGVAKFNQKCRESVWKHIDVWYKYRDRVGYWVDKDNPYVTYHNDYIESLWNVVSKINDKKLLYKDYKVVPWCPRCGTGLSSHELAQGYQDVKDLSVYVKFKIKSLGLKALGLEEKDNAYFLAWTTTPWTLPGNVALAVGKDIKYDLVQSTEDSEWYIVAKDLNGLDFYKSKPGLVISDKTFLGKDLVGLEYEPLFPFLQDQLPVSEKAKFKNAFKVYPADFVNTTDGTGIVHTAVMYGQDDFALGTKVGLPKHHLVKEDGTFKDGCGFLSGRFVKEVDANGKPTLAVDIVDDLKKRNLFFKQENYKHSYPHCWRCKTPLIYYARDSYYIKMSSLRSKLLSENKKINWEPSYIKDGRFGEWLKDVKDWAISRERYWGTPLPLWATDDAGKKGGETMVVDSIETLRKFVKKSGNKYFLMRHGEATHNLKNVLSSDTEEKHPLTPKGREDVENSVAKIKKNKIDLIIHSPLLRAKETAEIISKALDVPMQEDKRLREEDFGDLSGKPWSEFEKIYPTFEDRLYKRYDGAETVIEIKKRVGEFIYEIENTYKDKNILIVTHDGPAKLLKCVEQGILDKDIRAIYKPGENFLEVGELAPLDFVQLPHDEEYRLDLHKPYIDEIKLISKKGKEMTRVKEVMDVWFDSGAMPFAQDHYLFDSAHNKPLVYPADFISEAIDQTRGWFYTLLAVGVLMGKGTPYKNVICLGHLNDKDGKKMSKSVGNVIDPWQMIEKYGVDALRLWMYSVNQPGEPKNFDEKTVDEIVKKYFNLLANVLSFYEMHRDKSLESNEIPQSNSIAKNILDVWIITRLSELVAGATKNMDSYKVLEPVREIRGFIEDLSTWYLRRSRDRFRDGDVDAKKTLYFVLKTVAKVLAPFAPFYAEYLYGQLRAESDPISVHLESWPQKELRITNYELRILEEMKEVRKIVSQAMEIRQRENIKVRQPLSKLFLKKYNIDEKFISLIKDEINVKEIIQDQTGNEIKIGLDTIITPELKEEGIVREFIRNLQDLRKEKGYEANDRAELYVSSNEEFKKLVKKYEGEIKKVVGLTEISFVRVAETHMELEGFTMEVGFQKN